MWIGTCTGPFHHSNRHRYRPMPYEFYLDKLEITISNPPPTIPEVPFTKQKNAISIPVSQEPDTPSKERQNPMTRFLAQSCPFVIVSYEGQSSFPSPLSARFPENPVAPRFLVVCINIQRGLLATRFPTCKRVTLVNCARVVERQRRSSRV